MDDLISRQALMKEFADFVRASNNSDFAETPTRNDAVSLVGSMQSAQPEIIRCKDCKHYVIHTLFGHRQGWCERLCDEYDKSLARGTEEDDFCSYGEEKSDDE